MRADTQNKRNLYSPLRPHSTSKVSVTIIPESEVASNLSPQLSPQWNLALHWQIRQPCPQNLNQTLG